MVLLPEGLHGAYDRSELNRLLGRVTVEAAVDDGRLAVFSRGVVVEAARFPEFRTRAAAALLLAGPRSVLCRESALVMHGCSAADNGPVHLMVPYYRKLDCRPGVIVHNGLFADQDVEELEELRVLNRETALADLLCRGQRRAALACADEALRLLPVQERAEFLACVDASIRARPDPRGRRRAMRLVELATGLPESPPESWLLLALVDGGLPVPVPQFSVCDLDGVERYRLDFAWPDLRVAVEYDGYAAHESRKERDAARDRDLRRRGWLVIRADASDLRDTSDLIASVRAAFRSRGIAA